MKVRVLDIPKEGFKAEFAVPLDRVNARLRPTDMSDHEMSNPQNYAFALAPQSNLLLEAEGLTVTVKGQVDGVFKAACSRCAEEFERATTIPIALVLKSGSSQISPDQDESASDLSFAYYEGVEIDCVELILDFILLGLPYSVVCSEECKGLCPVCGTNRNLQTCNCKVSTKSDSPFAVLQGLKVH